jgi:hypothetical protein
MKPVLYISMLMLGLLSCNNQTSQKATDTTDTNAVETVQTTSIEKSPEKIYIKDKSLYDPVFIAKLSEYNEPIKLIDNYILVGRDTVYFPEDLPLNKETIFKGANDQNAFVLTVTRINLTTLNYSFQLSGKDNSPIINRTGKATLSLFFLGSETDDDEVTGDGYLSTEYWHKSSDCDFAIRIGEKDDNEKLRAKIKLHCKDDKLKTIDLDDIPTLRTE